ncbi:leucine-rich repeat-containing protein 34-like isoform X1 [Biomphalaria glabrata]|uniref:Leucine-rich repeat-containing protein 34-like isoform X1 n=1 Tax=Biomphalaria glabrata TaxID=6526 RepID=A0A2C9JGL4_BIOGL|nr:leucine-rich repeat-containing protein 34-like isoform X1 [Biomphalaria glabrata]XP_013070075.1 leucine-rich repeat-containing protein 34-like isoform X1 [Biomphalaria glabrata]
MSDIISTVFCFENACIELAMDPPQYISNMLEKEKENNVLRQSRNEEFQESMHLYLAGNHPQLTTERITDEDCLVLYKTLETNRYVRSIDLRYNLITDKGATVLGRLLEVNKFIEELNLMCNNFGSEGAAALAKALLTNTTVKVLRLNGNKIGNNGGMCFAQALQVNTTLENLDIGDADLTIECLIALATVLRENKTLKALNVNRPILWTVQEEPTDHFTRMIKVNKGLRELHMQKYNMRDFGASRLAENLVFNTTLTYLDLSCNRITRDGVKELAKVLKLNTPLKILDLGFNRLEDDGAMHLADAIGTYNTTLECLNIVSNKIGPKGLCSIADALNFNSTLTSLFIWGNIFDDSVCMAFAEHLHSERLQEHNCDIRTYVVDGKVYLSQTGYILRRHYYYAPIFGDDVPEWQIRGEHPRRADHSVLIINQEEECK